ncbi:MAG: hypothetical protein E6R13_08530 [Spirochaetes bacterium]|nr:MAG: hypothetical protein E6R13_08530 [Spirochaetota bacterium]
MKYEDIITTVTSIVNDETIYKKGLILTYELDEKEHIDLNEEVFHLFNPMTVPFIPEEEFEIAIGGIVVKLIRKVA